MEIIIYDKRGYQEFNTITFSGYKKNDVSKALIDTINKQDIENALLWSTELLCSGKLKEFWDCILLVMSKNIHVGNPKLPIYIAKRFIKFKEIIQNGYTQDELQVRNSNDMRLLVAEIVCVLCYSPKKPSFEQIKLNKTEDFKMSLIGSKLKADSMEWYKKIFKENDPKEIIVAINEFGFHLYKKNLLKCCYWIEWLIEYDLLCRKEKKPIIIEQREFINVDNKYTSDPIWLVWDFLFLVCKADTIKLKIVQSLLELFCIKYNFSQKKKRRYLLYFAVEIYTELFDTSISIIKNSEQIKKIKTQINNFYKSIKQYEQAPEIINESQANLNRTLNKMNILYNELK
jgi:hypothetical protein